MARRTKVAARTTPVPLTGTVYDWNDHPSEYRLIDPKEGDTYENADWVVSRTIISNRPGKISAERMVSFKDGDIQIQPKSSSLSRENQKGGHTNYGYGGYYKGYVWIDGRRQRLLDFWQLFPNQEHHFDQQGLRRQAIERIRAAVRTHAGRMLTKVKGGWRLFADNNSTESPANTTED